MPTATVSAVCKSVSHRFSKPVCDQVKLLAGHGVEGDTHAGKTVKHRSRVAVDPSQANLRQVHLIHEDLHRELQGKGFKLGPGAMGENITTRGIDLLELPTGTRLKLGPQAEIEITGLRNPCKQLDEFQPGLMQAVLDRAPSGALIRKAGIMAIVTADGIVRPGDVISIHLPDRPFKLLERV